MKWQIAASGTQDWSTVGGDSFYKPTTADSGKDLQLLIRYTDGQHYNEILSPLTATIKQEGSTEGDHQPPTMSLAPVSRPGRTVHQVSNMAAFA